MHMKGQTTRIAAAGVQIFIIGVFHTTSILAQEPLMPRVPGPVAPAAMPAGAAPMVDPDAADASAVTLLVGRSTLIDVGSSISRVSLTSAEVADALVTSPNQLLVHGKEPGAISMFVWNRGGAVKRYEIVVQRDLARLNDQMAQLFPGEPIQVHSSGKQIVVSGKVSTKEVGEKVVAVAAGYVAKKEDVVTLFQTQPAPASNQVLLRVRFAEVSRSAMTEFGMSIFTSPTGIGNTIGRATTQQFPAPTYSDLAWTKADGSWGSDVTSAEGKINFSDFLNLFLLNQKYDLGLLIKALQNRGLFESLAEPNLVAESGKEASFLAGGEFPIPVVQGSATNAAVSVQFKEFGVRLNFTPTVNGDRVHLKVKPEVSTLDYGNAVVLNGFRIPALSTRRTETELELRDGQTFAIAGLMNNQMQSTLQKIPGIGDIPILGNLFKSRAAQKNQTELVVMITPEILRPNSPGVTTDLPRLPEAFMPPIPQEGTLAAPPAAFAPRVSSQAVQPPAATPVAPPLAQAVDPRQAEREAQAAMVARQIAERADSAARADADKAAAEAQAKAARDAAVTERAAAKQAEADARTQAAERVRLEKEARAQAERDAKAADKARREMAKRDAAAQKELERQAKELARKEAEAAKEQSKREAAAAAAKAREKEQASNQAPAAVDLTPRAMTQQELDAMRASEEQRALEAATAEKVRAAEADYQAELARRSQR